MSDEYDPHRECSVCGAMFDIDAEGGTEGHLGILPVAFCPTCLAGVSDLFEQLTCPVCSQLDELRGALLKYGKHLTDCLGGISDRPCTCGLEELINPE